MKNEKNIKTNQCDNCNNFDSSIMAVAILTAFALGIILAYESRSNLI